MSTKLEQDLDAAKALVASLEAKKAELEAVFVAAPLPVRQLAVGLHGLMCTLTHGIGAGECGWSMTPSHNDAINADWTEYWHSIWLDRAQLGIAKLREIGYTVVDPQVDNAEPVARVRPSIPTVVQGQGE